MLEVRVTKCKGDDNISCKSEPEIQEFLAKNKFMIWSLYAVIDYDN